MEKKLQVFVSSTFIDLKNERQAAVESILNAGHIPAGMELFKAGDESQKETIKRWINESDAYVLILGGRYGSIDKTTGKSYTHWEYDYAGERNIPRFALVIDESALEEKAKKNGTEMLEMENQEKLKDFRQEVLQKTSKFFTDIKDIKLYVLESLKEFERDKTLIGWISGKKLKINEELLEENRILLKENAELTRKNKKLEDEVAKEDDIYGYSYKEIKDYLDDVTIKYPDYLLNEMVKSGPVTNDKNSLLNLLIIIKDELAIGIDNRSGMVESRQFIFFHVAPKLLVFNLVEKTKVTGKVYQRIQLSKAGYKFLAMYEMEKLSKV